MTETVPADQWVRANAVHDAVSFHTLRRTPEEMRLSAVADTASRIEHYVQTGVFPLEPTWQPPAVTDSKSLGDAGQ